MSTSSKRGHAHATAIKLESVTSDPDTSRISQELSAKATRSSSANPFFVQLPTICPTRPTQPAHFKPNSLTTRLKCNQIMRPFYTRAQVESSDLEFLGVWYLRLTNIHPKLKLLRDPSIFKFSIAWACVKWPSSKWNIIGGMLLNKRHSWQAKECLKAHWLGAHKMRARALDILNYLMEID